MKWSPTHFFRWFSQVPPAVDPKNSRFFAVSNIGFLYAFGVHALEAVCFSLMGFATVGLFNTASALLYLGLIVINRRGRHATAVVLAWFEIVCYTVLRVHAFGWATGSYFVLFVLVIFIFLTPSKTMGWRTGLVAVTGLVFAGLYVFMGNSFPTHPLPRAAIHGMYLFNGILTFTLLSLAAFFYSRAAEKAEQILEASHAETEALLHNILPKSVADRLRSDPEFTAERFEQASILFSDIVGFTSMGEKMRAEDLVHLLNGIFVRFDDLCDKHGLEKIKTIGDAYMVASGLPHRNPSHAHDIALMALDMQAEIQSFSEDMRRLGVQNGPGLSMRIGIHSGPVVAGVIGKKKFIYDLWGDSVNTASRMESHGLAGEIQISRQTRELLDGAFELEKRGTVQIKGKGPMETWFLQGLRKPGP